MMATASNINGFGGVPGAYGNMAALHGAYGPGGAGLGCGYGGMHNSNNHVPHIFGSGNSQSGTASGAGNANVSLRERERERLPMRENVYGHRMGNDSSSQSSSFYAQQQQQRQHQRHSQKRGRGGW
jgi:hypothetical protein